MENQKKIVTCEFMGGLGNQLFQASHVIAQSQKHNRTALFRPRSETQRQGRETKYYTNNIFSKLEFIEFITDLDIVREKKWDYDAVEPSHKNTSFWGYFQSEKNFLSHKDLIIELFTPNQVFQKKILGIYPEIESKTTISLHVRRGDSFTAQNIHPIITDSYIKKCVEQFGKYDYIFCFSDDKTWVKENLNYKNMIFVENLEDYEELWMMSMCKNNIISNSTFSWWGAYLNKNPIKRVFVPSVWFGPNGPENYQDIYVDGWEKINVINENGWLK